MITKKKLQRQTLFTLKNQLQQSCYTLYINECQAYGFDDGDDASPSSFESFDK